MSYQYNFGQYNYNKDKANIFISQLSQNITVFKEDTINNPYSNIGYKFDVKFEEGKSYYCNGVIKKFKDSTQEYRVYLAYVNTDGTVEVKKETKQAVAYFNIDQYSGSEETKTEDQYQEFEFLFTPFGSDSDKQYNSLIFSLIRDDIDKGSYNSNDRSIGRLPIILLKEVDLVENVIGNIVSSANTTTDAEIVKVAVSSIADFSIALNNEAIKTNRSGLYELVDGFITVNRIGFYTPAKLFKVVNGLTIYNGITSDTQYKQALDYYPVKSILDVNMPLYDKKSASWDGTASSNMLYYLWAGVNGGNNNSIEWEFNDFSVDYVYRNNSKGVV